MQSSDNFISFLKGKYNLKNINAWSESFKAFNEFNTFYTAYDPTGKQIFIKRCRIPELVVNEYRISQRLYELNSHNFPEAISFCADKKNGFVALEYIQGETLYNALQSQKLNESQKENIIDELYKIYRTLKTSGIVHRDLHAGNILIEGGRLVLIDCQIAVSRSNYQEIYHYRNPRVIKAWSISRKTYHEYVWDDAYSILLIIRDIIMTLQCKSKFKDLLLDMVSDIGKNAVWYRIPDKRKNYQQLFLYYIKSKLSLKQSRRLRYQQQYHELSSILSEIKSLHNHTSEIIHRATEDMLDSMRLNGVL